MGIGGRESCILEGVEKGKVVSHSWGRLSCPGDGVYSFILESRVI